MSFLKPSSWEGEGWKVLPGRMEVEIDGIVYKGHTKPSSRDCYQTVGIKELRFRNNTPWPVVVLCIRQEVANQDLEEIQRLLNLATEPRKSSTF